MTREEMQEMLKAWHYTHSVPSGKSLYFETNGVIVVFSIPANYNISTFLVGEPNKVWELSRLWAEDGHEPNALTRALSAAVSWFKEQQPGCQALVSYADPNVGHEGFVYKAASWVPLGRSAESRYYRSKNGQLVSRRKFHSGKRCLRKSEIESMGYTQHNLPGKLRFGKGLTRRARKLLEARRTT